MNNSHYCKGCVASPAPQVVCNNFVCIIFTRHLMSSENPPSHINIYLQLHLSGAARVRFPLGTLKMWLRSVLTKTLIKTMKLIIIWELQSSAIVVMRPHRSRRIKNECNK